MATEAAALLAAMAADPALAEVIEEECRCLAESAPFVIRSGPDGMWPDPIMCECCGAKVRLADMAGVSEDYRVRHWEAGIWEAENGGFRHTVRRCEWWREHGRQATCRYALISSSSAK